MFASVGRPVSVFGITFIRYTQYRNIGKPNNLKVGARKQNMHISSIRQIDLNYTVKRL